MCVIYLTLTTFFISLFKNRWIKPCITQSTLFIKAWATKDQNSITERYWETVISSIFDHLLYASISATDASNNSTQSKKRPQKPTSHLTVFICNFEIGRGICVWIIDQLPSTQMIDYLVRWFRGNQIKFKYTSVD